MFAHFTHDVHRTVTWEEGSDSRDTIDSRYNHGDFKRDRIVRHVELSCRERRGVLHLLYAILRDVLGI